jgi:hypothetical protein
MQSIAVLGRKRSVIRHQQRWPPKQAVPGLRQRPTPDAEYEPFRASIIGILNKFSQEGPPIAYVLINVRKERLDGLDLVKRAANDARIGASVDLWRGFCPLGPPGK